MKQVKFIDGNEMSTSANVREWIDSCQLGGNDDLFFQRFRSSPAFLQIVEGSPKVSAVWNLKRLLKNEYFLNALSLICTSDYAGCPVNQVLIKDEKESLIRSVNPTTLRYANNAANCIDIFGRNIFSDDLNIYEIGAGYGGECKIFNDYAMSIYSKPLSNWSVFDLPSSFSLIKKFLNRFGYKAGFQSLDDVSGSDRLSLVMSNAALSEMRGALLEKYMNNCVSHASHGYFITNFDTHSKPYGGWSTTEFLGILHDMGKDDARELDTLSYLSHFDMIAGSRLIVFGTDAPKKRDTYSLLDIAKINAIKLSYRITSRLMIGA